MSPSKLAALKSVSKTARGQRITMPTQETIRLTLKAFVFLEYLPTMTTDKPEAAAESNARMDPIMLFPEGCGSIKTNLSYSLLMNRQKLVVHCTSDEPQVIGKFLFEIKIAY
jgi:hypothetical protein